MMRSSGHDDLTSLSASGARTLPPDGERTVFLQQLQLTVTGAEKAAVESNGYRVGCGDLSHARW